MVIRIYKEKVKKMIERRGRNDPLLPPPRSGQWESQGNWEMIRNEMKG